MTRDPTAPATTDFTVRALGATLATMFAVVLQVDTYAFANTETILARNRAITGSTDLSIFALCTTETTMVAIFECVDAFVATVRKTTIFVTSAIPPTSVNTNFSQERAWFACFVTVGVHGMT